MGIRSLDPRLESLIELHTEPERIATGLTFTEGPLWLAQSSALLFSDLYADTIYRWTESGGHQVYRKPSAQANGNTLDAQGRLLSCEHINRRVSRTLADGSVETVVDSYEGKRLNSPNDLVCGANGDIYFTDPPYGLRRPDGSFAEGELGFNGVFHWRASDGRLTLLAGDFVRPNGLALTTDGRRLLVADTQLAHVRALALREDGSAVDEGIFCRTEHDGVTARPDGMKLDLDGNLYVASSTPQGVWVYSPQGDLLGQIGTPEGPANIAFGGDDWSKLFVTAQTSVYRVRLKVKGQPVGPA